jgi:ankyrin repeat protein
MLLLTHKANIYAADHRQWTPLHYASYNGHKKVCNYLLKWDADKDQLRDKLNSQNKLAIIIAKNPETKKGFLRKFYTLLYYLDIWRAC